MDKQHFDRLVEGVRAMMRHMAGRPVRGARVTELAAPDERTIREAAQIGQSQSARPTSVSLRTLQHRARRRARP